MARSSVVGSILKLGGVNPNLIWRNTVTCFRTSYARNYSNDRGGTDDDAPRSIDDYKDPVRMIKEEFKRYFTEGSDYKGVNEIPIPRDTDVCIIGGGAVGSAVSYALKSRNSEGIKVAVIERDPTFRFGATCLSAGGLRQQFSLKENIELSLYTAEFLRKIKEHLSIHGQDPPDVQFNPQGYLMLATEEGAETMDRNYEMQVDCGCKIQRLTPTKLKAKFPWLNTDGIALATYGLENEGWFDPWLLLSALRNKSKSMGTEFLTGEVVGFRFKEEVIRAPDGLVRKVKKLDMVEIKHSDGKVYPMRFAAVVNAAGPWSGEIARMAGVGTEDSEGALRFPLPVEPRKRYVYCIHNPNGPGLDTPFLVDPSGFYLRREGLAGHYICGKSPSEADPVNSDANVDPDHFNNALLPALLHRIPSLRSQLELSSSWAGYYDYNYYDQNLIIGNHPFHNNMFVATGMSGHGIQQAPGIGRAVAELIIDSEFITIDLSAFGWDRIFEDLPIYESNLV